MPDPIEMLTLREKIREADRLTRDLREHLELGFLPKAHELRNLCRPVEDKPDSVAVADITIRAQCSQLIQSDRFTAQLDDQAERYYAAIVVEVERIVHG